MLRVAWHSVPYCDIYVQSGAAGALRFDVQNSLFPRDRERCSARTARAGWRVRNGAMRVAMRTAPFPAVPRRYWDLTLRVEAAFSVDALPHVLHGSAARGNPSAGDAPESVVRLAAEWCVAPAARVGSSARTVAAAGPWWRAALA